MTEVVPIPITALIPVFAFPLLGILDTAELCLVYMKVGGCREGGRGC